MRGLCLQQYDSRRSPGGTICWTSGRGACLLRFKRNTALLGGYEASISKDVLIDVYAYSKDIESDYSGHADFFKVNKHRVRE